MDPKDWRFPMACLACQAVAVFPFRAHTLKDELRLELRCRNCHHEWVMSSPHPVMFYRNQDRRSEPVV